MPKTKTLKRKAKSELAPSQHTRPWQMSGEDQDDVLVPRVTLHQGTLSEPKYGQHPSGTLLNSATLEVISSRRFVAVGVAWKQWTKFGPNIGDPFEYSTRDKADVLAEDLEWCDGQPPAAQLTRNFVVLFEGHETPVCLSLRDASTFQRNAGKSLNQKEKVRAAQKLGPGLYEIDVCDRQNSKGAWKDLRIRFVGEPSDELAGRALEWFEALSTSQIRTGEGGETPF